MPSAENLEFFVRRVVQGTVHTWLGGNGIFWWRRLLPGFTKSITLFCHQILGHRYWIKTVPKWLHTTDVLGQRGKRVQGEFWTLLLTRAMLVGKIYQLAREALAQSLALFQPRGKEGLKDQGYKWKTNRESCKVKNTKGRKPRGNRIRFQFLF